jgi:hypothetical protein
MKLEQIGMGKEIVKRRLFFLEYFPQLGFQCFLCGGGMLPLYFNFPAHYVPGFLHGGQGFSVKRRIFGMQGAIIPINTGFSGFSFGFHDKHKRLLWPKYNLYQAKGQAADYTDKKDGTDE